MNDLNQNIRVNLFCRVMCQPAPAVGGVACNKAMAAVKSPVELVTEGIIRQVLEAMAKELRCKNAGFIVD